MVGLSQEALIATVGHIACALPIRDVVETMRPLPVEPVADAPPFVLGVSVIRSRPTVVVDLARLVTPAADPQAGAAERYVLVRTGDRKVALRVDACAGVRRLDAGDFSSLPPLLKGACGDAIDALGALDRHLCLVLEAARVLPAGLHDALLPERIP